MTRNTDVWHISPLTAEFTDPQTEAGFRAHTADSMARHLRGALWGWIAVLVLVCWFDYRFYGFDPGGQLLLVSRLVVIAGLLLVILHSYRSPSHITDGYAVTFMEVMGFAAFLLIFLLRPELTLYNVGAMMVLLIATYVFIPNRLVTAAFAVLSGIAGMMATMWLVGMSDSAQAGLFMLLVIPSALGHAGAYRLHRTQREQYVLLCKAEDVNAQLVGEIEQRKQLERELKYQAITDPLTGLYNRRHFEELYERERQRAGRTGSPLTLVMVDLDFFKEINDRYGHECGDIVLQNVAGFLRDAMRQTDVVARLGGEEFMLLLPDTATGEAKTTIERLRHQLAERTSVLAGEVVSVTATFALTTIRPETDSLNDALRTVDMALYRGKDEGRNRLVVVSADAA
ncbi:MAG: GGDEF domain-containing protein [Pseudohongiellaceae bacterium]